MSIQGDTRETMQSQKDEIGNLWSFEAKYLKLLKIGVLYIVLVQYINYSVNIK